MAYKYTSDGKKVAVIGALNTKETIVQEIFVTNGTEFPAGEHFVVKTLLDAPAETYQSRKIKDEEKTLKILELERDKIKQELSQFRQSLSAAASKIKWTESISNDEVKRIVDHIRAVVCGEFTHVLFDDYSGVEVREWEPELFAIADGYGEHRRFGGIGMAQLYGVWNGRLALDWMVSRYSDGSGSSQRFIPCKSYEEAIQTARRIIYDKDSLSDVDFEFCKKHGIPVEADKNEVRITKKANSIKKQIEEKKAQILRLEESLKDYEMGA